MLVGPFLISFRNEVTRLDSTRRINKSTKTHYSATRYQDLPQNLLCHTVAPYSSRPLARATAEPRGTLGLRMLKPPYHSQAIMRLRMPNGLIWQWVWHIWCLNKNGLRERALESVTQNKRGYSISKRERH